MLYQLIEESDLKSNRLVITRYKIARNVYANKSFGKVHYDRIIRALEKWKSIVIKFEGIFYEGDNYTLRYFGVRDNVKLDKETRLLSLQFNEDYIKQIQESKFYKYIDFEEYKKLTKPISARLYEILIKTFKERDSWFIDIGNLAEKLTIEKREQAKTYYPSDLLPNIKAAISEINKKTELKLELNYDKDKQICTFKKLTSAKPAKKIDQSESANNQVETSLIQRLTNYGFTKQKAHLLIDQCQSNVKMSFMGKIKMSFFA